MSIFTKDKNYTLQEIISICDNNDLITVDCLKDENMVSVEEWDNGDGGDCIFEFKRNNDNLFKLTWVETDLRLISRFK